MNTLLFTYGTVKKGGGGTEDTQWIAGRYEWHGQQEIHGSGFRIMHSKFQHKT
jgi:hypothetical protein